MRKRKTRILLATLLSILVAITAMQLHHYRVLVRESCGNVPQRLGISVGVCTHYARPHWADPAAILVTAVGAALMLLTVSQNGFRPNQRNQARAT